MLSSEGCPEAWLCTNCIARQINFLGPMRVEVHRFTHNTIFVKQHSSSLTTGQCRVRTSFFDETLAESISPWGVADSSVNINIVMLSRAASTHWSCMFHPAAFLVQIHSNVSRCKTNLYMIDIIASARSNEKAPRRQKLGLCRRWSSIRTAVGFYCALVPLAQAHTVLL